MCVFFYIKARIDTYTAAMNQDCEDYTDCRTHTDQCKTRGDRILCEMASRHFRQFLCRTLRTIVPQRTAHRQTEDEDKSDTLRFYTLQEQIALTPPNHGFLHKQCIYPEKEQKKAKYVIEKNQSRESFNTVHSR